MRVIKDMAIVEPLVDVVEPKQVCVCVGGGGAMRVPICYQGAWTTESQHVLRSLQGAGRTVL